MSEQNNTSKKQYEQSQGGLWEEQDRNQEIYFSGKLEVNGETIRFNCFPNRFKKEGENTPDFRLYINKPKAVDPKQSYAAKVKKLTPKSKPTQTVEENDSSLD